MPVIARRILIFFLSLIPIAWLFNQAISLSLGPAPGEAIVKFTGEWTIYFLLITLAVTPLRRFINYKKIHFRWLQTHRRMLGLFTLFYALTHLAAFYLFILGADTTRFSKELVERPYILVTVPAVILLILLGITSTQSMMRRLGKNWVRLHQSIYVIALLAWLHVFMQVRSSYYDAVLFGVLFLLVLLPRVYWRFSKVLRPS
jgi:methionine sulfoxide reductase heme-binding subunit